MPDSDHSITPQEGDPEGTVEALRAGKPALRCEWPDIRAATVPVVAGDLEMTGWAVSPSGIDTVTVEVETRGAFDARVNVQRPDVREAFFPAGWSRRPGFEVSIPTDGWTPGTYALTITARDSAAATCSLTGRIRWHPSDDQLAADIAAGRPALWLGEPWFDADHPVGDFVSVRGWVRARAKIESVVVDLEGVGAANAFCRIPVPDATTRLPVDSPPGFAFSAVLDGRELEPGSYGLTVKATGRNGRSSARSGEVVLDPGERSRRWLSDRDRTSSDAIACSGATPGPPSRTRLCVTGGEPSAELRSSVTGQLHQPSVMEHSPPAGLQVPLRDLLDDAGANAVAFVGSGDVLDPRALAMIAERLEAPEPPDLIYADHDVLDPEGRRANPFLKPGWSPELLLSLDYLGSFVTVGRAAAEAALRIGSMPIETVYALLLSLVDEPLRVERIPEVLCTRGVCKDADAPRAEEDAVREVGRRRGRSLESSAQDAGKGLRELRWEVAGRPMVSVVIPTSGAEDPLSHCLRSLRERTAYRPFEVVLVDSGGDAAAVAAGPLAGIEHRVVAFRERFNFSRACNLGAQQSRGDFLLFLNDDTEALSERWIERMVGYAQLPAVGVVGAKLLFPEGLVQHGGLVLDELPPPPGDPFVSAAFSYLEAASSGYRDMLAVPRDCSAVTGACLMIPAGLLRELGGWDEQLRMDFGDVDLCLRAREAGHRVVVEPRAVLLHRESATQGHMAHAEQDVRLFLHRWSRRYGDGDPWYHPACRFGRDWELG